MQLILLQAQSANACNLHENIHIKKKVNLEFFAATAPQRFEQIFHFFWLHCRPCSVPISAGRTIPNCWEKCHKNPHAQRKQSRHSLQELVEHVGFFYCISFFQSRDLAYNPRKFRENKTNPAKMHGQKLVGTIVEKVNFNIDIMRDSVYFRSVDGLSQELRCLHRLGEINTSVGGC